MRSASIYTLSDPCSGAVRYVGQSVRPKARLAEHLRDARKGCTFRCHCWIRSLLAGDLKPLFAVVEETTIDLVDAAEQRWIAFHRGAGADLTNHTHGGGGISGYKLSPETRQRLSATRVGNPSRRGQQQSDDEKAKRAASNRGKKRSPEFCERMRVKALGVTHSEAAKLKMGETKRATISAERRSEIARIANRASQEAKKCHSRNV